MRHARVIVVLFAMVAVGVGLYWVTTRGPEKSPVALEEPAMEEATAAVPDSASAVGDTVGSVGGP